MNTLKAFQLDGGFIASKFMFLQHVDSFHNLIKQKTNLLTLEFFVLNWFDHAGETNFQFGI